MDFIKESQSGENNEDQGGENSTVNPEDIDFAAIMAGNGATDVVWGKQDEATKQAKHLAMYAEGFFFVFSRSVFGFR